MPFQKGQSGNAGGRPAKTAQVRKAEKLLRKSAVRFVERLKELVESPDDKVAVVAVKVALAKVMPDLRHEEKTLNGEVAVTLNAEERRAAVEVLRALADSASGDASTHH